jgi:2-aminoethylphosphonate-pyruvate transaminase
MKRTKQYLFCPGPVNVASNIKKAVITHEISHREQEFSELKTTLNTNILKLFNLNPEEYHSVIVTGSGTAANEAVLSSVVAHKHIVVIANGEFGERIYEISKLHNKNTHLLSFGWANPMDLAKIEEYLKNNHVDIVAVVHHETSIGMLNPIEKIGELTKKYHTMFLVDAVSSAGADEINITKSNISFITTSAAKALASLPGISVVVGKISAFEAIKNNPQKTMYLHLPKFYEYSIKYAQTPNTPAVYLFYGLNQAIENILHEGVKNRFALILRRAEKIRKGIKKIGLKALIDEKYMSAVLTTVVLPPHVSFATLQSRLREKHIIVYNGKKEFENKVFQISNIGEMSNDDINYMLEVLNEIFDVDKIKTNARVLSRSQQAHRIRQSHRTALPFRPAIH